MRLEALSLVGIRMIDVGSILWNVLTVAQMIVTVWAVRRFVKAQGHERDSVDDWIEKHKPRPWWK